MLTLNIFKMLVQQLFNIQRVVFNGIDNLNKKSKAIANIIPAFVSSIWYS